MYICGITLHMINYSSQYQTKITEFCSINSIALNPGNRWILLGHLLPWDELFKIYKNNFSEKMGAGSKNPRVIIGAFIIKHKLCISDEETLDIISENPYMQFFMGLNHFCPQHLFSPTLFVEMRKKLGKDTFDAFSRAIISLAHPDKSIATKGQPTINKGKLKIDATVADQYIRYPNDLGLVNEARIKTEGLVDQLFELLRDTLNVKPRTYRKSAHKRYLAEAKKKKKSKKEIRKALRVLLNCVGRNLGHVDKMLDMLGDDGLTCFTKKQYKDLLVIRELYIQQKAMYDQSINTCADRIVSISQPHVRPIVRGKQGKSVEFGSKLGLSLSQGYLTNETLSWDAYNEASDLKQQAKAYQTLFGYYPELIQADKIYATNENRKWCKQNNIRLTATPKGRPVEKTAYQKAKEKKEYAERNAVEGRIGNAKQTYSLNQIKAKLKNTSQTWIAATIFTMNIARWLKDFNATF